MQYVLKRYPQRDGVDIHLVDMFFINSVAGNWRVHIINEWILGFVGKESTPILK